MWGHRPQLSNSEQSTARERLPGGNDLAGNLERNRSQTDPDFRHAGSLPKGPLRSSESPMAAEFGDRVVEPAVANNYISVPSYSLMDSRGQVLDFPSSEASQLVSSAPSPLPVSLSLMSESTSWFPASQGLPGVYLPAPYNQSFQDVLGNPVVYFPSLMVPAVSSNIAFSSLPSHVHNQVLPVSQHPVACMPQDNVASLPLYQFPQATMPSVFGQPLQASATMSLPKMMDRTSTSQVQIQADGGDLRDHELKSSMEEPGPAPTQANIKETSGGSFSRKQEESRKGKNQSGKPKRPLSAYNLFFKDERAKLLNGESSTYKTKPASSDSDVSSEVTGSEVSSSRRKVGFAEMARIISAKWRKIDPETQAKYQAIAMQEMERYKEEKELYLQRQQASLEQSRALMESTVDDDTRREYFARFATKSKCKGSRRKSKRSPTSPDTTSPP